MKKKNIVEYLAVGRRKTAIASVCMRKGKGNVNINGREFENYFPSELDRKKILEPLDKFGSIKDYDLLIRLTGGGLQAQAEAIRLGLARAMVEQDEELKGKLKDCGFLTRDPRKRERKKYGLAGARKRFQFSKR
jgi:small subunit ribosomal protein S9